MNQYLIDTEEAAKHQFVILTGEFDALQSAQKEYKTLRATYEALLHRSQIVSLNPPGYTGFGSFDDDEDGIATASYWEAHFDVAPKVDSAQAELQRIKDRISNKRHSLDAISGAILQYAKQGISIVHGDLASCPPGRKLGLEDLKNVLWQGRNQAMHWEEGKFHKAVTECFTSLTNKVCSEFAEFPRKSQAFHLLYHAGWTSYDGYLKDMQILLP